MLREVQKAGSGMSVACMSAPPPQPVDMTRVEHAPKVLLPINVPDHGSRDRDVVLVRHTIGSGKPRGSGIWNGEGMGRGRSVYEQPGTKVDGIASRQRRVSK
jgi:hypothetical protein